MTAKYFTDANSATGYVSLQKENLAHLTSVYHLLSFDEPLIHHILEQLSCLLAVKQINVEYIYATFNPQFLAGIVMREQGVIITSGKVVMADATVIDLSGCYDASKLRKRKDDIDRLKLNMNQSYKLMYMHLNAALLIHDEWEKIYIDRMNYRLADEFRAHLIEKLFDTDIPASQGPSSIVRRFFGALTPGGIHDFIPELTAGLKRYLIKGRPGSGKSTLMKEVMKKAVELGYDVDVYHCSLDVKSLDMVVVPELHFCLFDATSPHEYEATFSTDEVIDTYSAFIKDQTDERCANILESIESRYKNQINAAQNAMKQGHDYRRMLHDIYKEARGLGKVDGILAHLISQIN